MMNGSGVGEGESHEKTRSRWSHKIGSAVSTQGFMNEDSEHGGFGRAANAQWGGQIKE